MKKSALQIARTSYEPKIPKILKGVVEIQENKIAKLNSDQIEIKKLFPNTYGLPVLQFVEGIKKHTHYSDPINVGVILSGGQAPGGHNVIAGLFDSIKSINSSSRLYGFLMGPDGLINHKYKELTKNIIDEYRNVGGFDIIGSGRTKLESKEQFDEGLKILKKLNIKGLVIVGGDDSNTNACVLAEYYKQISANIQVIGCPKTIDGDLKNEMIETSFGFDTACKVYSEMIGNIQKDCNSSRKYWHFIKLMGRSASHIALECALQVQPNICIISEEVMAKNQSLDDIVQNITDIIIKRANKGYNFGTILIPEGLIEFIPTIKVLINELNEYLTHHEVEFKCIEFSKQRDHIINNLSKKNSAIYKNLPETLSRQLILDRDPHGNIQVSLIETEKLLVEMTKERLIKMAKSGEYTGKFTALTHFFGYEGRCAYPSNYDSNYCYSLGYVAAKLINNKKTGYMSAIFNTTAPTSEWIAGGIPITTMMNMERRHGEMKPVIKKALVKLDGAPFQLFISQRDKWAISTNYIYPGPIQYFGPSEICDQPPKTLQIEKGEIR
ncbi:MAG: diphosphate--fructose-6-phosphate 1-phosphotransferase [Bacteroidales bacterium OttesenSCG-928-I14]|jgi:pyrophosphate--fructose-6-phosphate 1-phosphotransferase|nr:diphosphate--fructose-6-phosphate 1-phosphotransferase [Bacteroidales bacterium OttesenSCG-928-I14]